MKQVHFSVCLGWAGSRLFKVGFRHSGDNMFHINTSSWVEKRPALKYTVIAKHVIARLTKNLEVDGCPSKENLFGQSA